MDCSAEMAETESSRQDHTEEETSCTGLQDILKEIKSFKTEFKMDLASFEHDIEKEVKEEIKSLKESINIKFTEIKSEVTKHGARQRIRAENR